VNLISLVGRTLGSTPKKSEKALSGCLALFRGKEFRRRFDHADFLRDCSRNPLIQRDTVFLCKPFGSSLD
jgi:hypothetical protein